MPDEFHQAFFICKTDASNKLQKENLLNQMKAFPKINYCEVYDPSTSAYFEFSKDASSESKKATTCATSSGFPKRPTGCNFISSASSNSPIKGF